jgi:hypothetical protein
VSAAAVPFRLLLLLLPLMMAIGSLLEIEVGGGQLFLLIRSVVFARHARRGWPDLRRTERGGLLPSEQGLRKADGFQSVRQLA